MKLTEPAAGLAAPVDDEVRAIIESDMSDQERLDAYWKFARKRYDREISKPMKIMDAQGRVFDFPVVPNPF